MNMRTILGVALAFGLVCSSAASSGKIVKTLPHFLDLQGRHTLHPSLFERDAYQAQLRINPENCSGIRFDVQWKARGIKTGSARLKLEVKGEKRMPRQLDVFERDLNVDGMFSRWTGVTIAGEDFAKIGAVQAWRVTLWDGDTLLAEQKSFLWQTAATPDSPAK